MTPAASIRPLLRALFAALVAAGAFVALASPAQAVRRGPCIPGTQRPTCTIWSGKVTFVADGDTVEAAIAGDGTSRHVRIRLTGIQAMEQSRYSANPRKRRGQCHALAATARLAQLIDAGHRRVRIAAQNRHSRTGTRIRRSISATIDGRLVDLGAALISEGHALWLPNSVEYAWNRRYGELAQQAAARRLQLWDSDACGVGPGDEDQLRPWAKWDAKGSDGAHVNGEWVKVKNLDASRDISLAGWWLRDSALRRYTFPRWAKIPAGATITLRIGRGGSAGRKFFWGQRRPVFENVGAGRRAMGDGAYLFDPQGDLRAWMMYPCRYLCAGAAGPRAAPATR